MTDRNVSVPMLRMEPEERATLMILADHQSPAANSDDDDDDAVCDDDGEGSEVVPEQVDGKVMRSLFQRVPSMSVPSVPEGL